LKKQNPFDIHGQLFFQGIKMLFMLSSLLIFSFPTFASPKAIYGEDNRKEVYESSAFYQELAKATAGMISDSVMSAKSGLKSDLLEILGPSLRYYTDLCPTERFGEQTAVATCSGFLIAPDLLVTAGHCINEITCSRGRWVFDYKLEQGSDKVFISRTNVYSCKKIMKDKDGLFADAAIVQLDRPVTDRQPLIISRKRARVGDELVMIGHPSGLPSKVTDGATVNDRAFRKFKTNLDAFAGNSGSAVMNAKTGEVVGILVKGKEDYTFNGTCRVATRHEGEGGEWVSDISQL
jgi:S1-C subfamily serine protease